MNGCANLRPSAATGRLVLTRPQLENEYIGRLKKIKPPAPKVDHLIFLTDEDAEARELFLTEHEIDHPLDTLESAGADGGGAAFFDVRHRSNAPGRGVVHLPSYIFHRSPPMFNLPLLDFRNHPRFTKAK